jgi:uncharacterized protein YjlB
MPIYEDVKKIVEKATGAGRPERSELSLLVRERKANAFRLRDDGETPNNPRLPLVLYRSPVKLDERHDPAAIFEDLFDGNGWTDSWRDSMYDFLHWHTITHEVLGIARGSLRAEFGGRSGRTLEVKAGDVLVLPAGTGHRALHKSDDLLIVGAYPEGSDYDEKQPKDGEHDQALPHITKVPLPPRDPVYGKDGPLLKVWTRSH